MAGIPPACSVRTEASSHESRGAGLAPAHTMFLGEALYKCRLNLQEETAGLIQLLVGTIESHPFPQSPDIQRLRDILRKLRPMPEPESNAAEIEDDA